MGDEKFMKFATAVEILYEVVDGTNEPPIRERVEIALDVVHDWLVNELLEEEA